MEIWITKSGADAVKFTVDVDILKNEKKKRMQELMNNYN